MSRIGIYNFTAFDWEELDFPLGLWLEHTLPLVDQICLVAFGSLDWEHHLSYDQYTEKLKIIELPYEQNNSLAVSFKGMQTAMEALDTDWKLQIPIDEFLSERPTFDGLDTSRGYVPEIHNLYGCLNYELVGPDSMMMLPYRPNRFHYGNQKLIGDSGDVDLPKHTTPVVDLWHTGYCRKPEALSRRLRTKVRNEVTGGIANNIKVLQYTDEIWDYRNYRVLWPKSTLQRVDRSKLPKILLDNEKRFTQVDWDE